MNLNEGQPWLPRSIDDLVNAAALGITIDEIALLLGRSEGEIAAKARELGLKLAYPSHR